MIIRPNNDGFVHAVASEITPQGAYLSRRSIIRGMAIGAGGLGLSDWVGREAFAQTARPGALPAMNVVPSTAAGALVLHKHQDDKDSTG